MDIKIKEISPSDKQVKELFQLLDSHNMSHCPPEICHLTQPEELEKIDSTLLGAYLEDKLCGMGGIKYYRDYGEITRMYVKDDYRGRGVAESLLRMLEQKAKVKGLNWLKLETSDKFKAACALYEKYGFSFCEPFGEYVEKPYNTYMRKPIG